MPPASISREPWRLIASLTLRMGELRRLTVAAALPFSCDRDAATVTNLDNGEPFGIGALVGLGKRLGPT